MHRDARPRGAAPRFTASHSPPTFHFNRSKSFEAQDSLGSVSPVRAESRLCSLANGTVNRGELKGEVRCA